MSRGGRRRIREDLRWTLRTGYSALPRTTASHRRRAESGNEIGRSEHRGTPHGNSRLPANKLLFHHRDMAPGPPNAVVPSPRNDKVICLSPTEVCPGTAAIVVTIFSLFATTALLVLDPLGEQLADHTPGIAQEFPAFAGRTIDSPSNAPLPFLDRAQVSVAL